MTLTEMLEQVLITCEESDVGIEMETRTALRGALRELDLKRQQAPLLTMQIEALKEALDLGTAAVLVGSPEVLRMEEELAALKASHTALAQELRGARMAPAELERKLEVVRAECTELHTGISGQNKIMSSLRDEVAECTRQRDQARREAKQAAHDYSAALVMHDNALRERDIAQKGQEALSVSHEAAQQEVRKLTALLREQTYCETPKGLEVVTRQMGDYELKVRAERKRGEIIDEVHEALFGLLSTMRLHASNPIANAAARYANALTAKANLR